MFAVILCLILVYGFTHFYSYDIYDYTITLKLFRNKLFSYVLT